MQISFSGKCLMHLAFITPFSIPRASKRRSWPVTKNGVCIIAPLNNLNVNLRDTQELLNAQKEPEEYQDLIVRVGGFSAYFVGLSRQIQDDVIGRSELSI